MAKITTKTIHASGIPLGGIGTGTTEIMPDGQFIDWQIFNLGTWAPLQPECCCAKTSEIPKGGLDFLVRTKQDSSMPLVRKLRVSAPRPETYDFVEPYVLPWLKNIQEIEFEGRYPYAALKYIDEDLPVAISSRIFSPIIPHDSKTSGTPGFYVEFSIKNLTSAPVEVSLAGVLWNPIAWGAEDRKLVNNAYSEGNTAFLNMKTDLECKSPTTGNMCFSVTGGEASWIAGDYNIYLNSGVAYGMRDLNIEPMHGFSLEFRENGRLPSLCNEITAVELLNLADEKIEKMTLKEKEDIVTKLRNHASDNYCWKIASVDNEDYLYTDEGLTAFLKSMRDKQKTFKGLQHSRIKEWGDGALCSSFRLAPYEEKEILFTLGWYFPYHFSHNGNIIGHMYENWFKDAFEVNRFLVGNFETHSRKTVSFVDALYDTSIDTEFSDAWAGQLSTLAKSSWWTRKGEFAIWEGLGCCGLHTTDVSYKGSFSILALFPDLQKGQMEMGSRFQRDDGRVHHFFVPDFDAVDADGFLRVDMNQEFVLLVCRDYLWTGDKDYLKRLWPNIVMAMNNTEKLDSDGDGLPDHDTKHNTYDSWRFSGTPTFISSLWISALLAGIRMAEEIGDDEYAIKWRSILDKCIPNFEKKLWNGEYYNLWVDESRADECCMTDQIDGETYSRIIGLGNCLPEDRIVSIMNTVFKYNYRTEDGLINASYPPGKKPILPTYGNFQAQSPWSGTEYFFAAAMIDFGMFNEARDIVRNVHKRHERFGFLWKHGECGLHYYRAMSSWTLLAAVAGFKIDVPRLTVTFNPVIQESGFHGPWVSSMGWGRYNITGNDFNLECESGVMNFKRLNLGFKGINICVCLNNQMLNASSYEENKLTVLNFEEEVRLREGDVLKVRNIKN